MARTGTQPDYIDPAGDARDGSLPVRPPFQFTGVTARVFPLKANMALVRHNARIGAEIAKAYAVA